MMLAFFFWTKFFEKTFCQNSFAFLVQIKGVIFIIGITTSEGVYCCYCKEDLGYNYDSLGFRFQTALLPIFQKNSAGK